MNRFAKKRGGPWYGEDKQRILFETVAFQHYPQMIARTERIGNNSRRIYDLSVEVPTFDRQKVQILFAKSRPELPIVQVDGPSTSLHRYPDGSLCMWYPKDTVAHRWVFGDGLHTLIAHIILHLFREEYWRISGEWVGEEAPHNGGE